MNETNETDNYNDNYGDKYWGTCPECGHGAERIFNVGRDHWAVCLRHKYRWWIGSNLFSGWRDEPASHHRENAEVLRGFREVQDEPSRSTLEGSDLTWDAPQPAI